MSIPAEPNASRVRPANGPHRRIAVFRALALGDMLCAVPALRALRAANPDAEVSLIGLPWSERFVGRFSHLLDRFVEFPGFPGIPERSLDMAGLMRLVAASQAEPYDLAIQLQGNGMHSNAFVEMLGARRSAGHFLPALGCPSPDSFTPYLGHGPEIRRHLGLMTFLGFPERGEHLEFPLTAADEAEARAIRDEADLEPQSFAVVHPGASLAARRWPPDRFARVADCIAQDGLRIVLSGTAAEGELTSAVARSMRTPAIDLAGRTSIGGFAALLRDARLLVSNDTGVAHVAAALRVPSVVIFLGSERDRWAALDTELHLGVGEGSKVGCRNHGDAEHLCLRDACAYPRPDDVPQDVPVDDVWQAVRRQLDPRNDRSAGAGDVA